MRFIPTGLHGVLDYTMAIFLMFSPWLFNFYNGGAETYVPLAIGAIILLQAMMTRNETGAMKWIPMPAHLVSDLAIGFFLALSPWIFMFHDLVWEPHVLFGLVIIGEAILSRMRPTSMSH